MTNAASPETIQKALQDLPGWTHANDALTKTFQLNSFREAMSFLVRLAFEAEARNHHPEIANVYATVTITLRTHDCGNCVTAKDIELAKAIQHCSWVG